MSGAGGISQVPVAPASPASNGRARLAARPKAAGQRSQQGTAAPVVPAALDDDEDAARRSREAAVVKIQKAVRKSLHGSQDPEGQPGTPKESPPALAKPK